MKSIVKMTRECPRCLRLYTGYPALSRRDNKTEICSRCGTEEAVLDAGITSWYFKGDSAERETRLLEFINATGY